MDIYYNNDYVACEYDFDTTRKSARLAEAVHGFNKQQAFSGRDLVSIASPSMFYQETAEIIEVIHDPKYVQAVKTGEPKWLAESQGFTWDANIYRMALAHSSGVVAAVSAALNGRSCGTFSSGLHHASKDTGYGFCTFNGIAAGVVAAKRRGAENILILDFDAHFGGGTYSLVGEEVTHVDVAVEYFDYYEIDETSGMSFCEETEIGNYVDSICKALAFADSKTYDLVIYNAGMDPINAGVSYEDLVEREALVSTWIRDRKYPWLFTLAGGYEWGSVTASEIVDLHMLTVSDFANINHISNL
jgi:acetoin utilization deacetylase AcuC-like enzyme